MAEKKSPEITKETKPLVKKRKEKRTECTENQFIGNILIEDLRGEHINKVVSITGILQDYSKVLPRTIKARFECPSCGTIISVMQYGEFIKEPKRCSCGRRGGFKLIDKEQVNFQIIKIREEPEKVCAGRIKRTIKVFLKEKLTCAVLEKTLKLQRKINIIGKVVESCSAATTSSLSLEAMYFTVGTQKGDKELRNYLMDQFLITADKAEFLIVLRNNFYNLTKSVMKYGIGRRTHYLWLEDEKYKEAYEYIESGKHDFLESEIIKKIKYSSDNISADMLKFYAKTKMGYHEKQQIEHSGKIDSKMEVEIVEIQKKEDENPDDGGVQAP